MGSITILLGRSRWRRRRALPERALSGVDALGRPDFLYLAASAAKRRVVERDFLAFRRNTPCFAPTVRVLDELADDLWLRHGDGEAILPRSAAEYLAEEVLISGGAGGERAGDGGGTRRWPWLCGAARPGPVARALVRFRDRLDAAGRLARPPDGLPHGAEIMDALRALEARFRALPGHVPRTVALRRLIDIVQSPSPALVRQLRATRTIILDDLLQPPPLHRALLVALCRAWESVGSHVVIGLETGRDLGGREVGVFFEYDDVDDVAYALRPFRATRGLRRTLFEELVASGEAELHLALRDQVLPIEPGAPIGQPEPADLSDHLYGPRPIRLAGAPVESLLRDTVRLSRHDTADAELAHTAASIKQVLLGGAAPTSCLLALPDLADRADQVRAVFKDHGVPIHLTRPGTLAGAPVAGVALRVARLALLDHPVDQTLALLTSDLVETPADVDIARLTAMVRAAGIRSGLPSSWRGALRAWGARQVDRSLRPSPDLQADLDALDAVIAPLASLARPMAPQTWAEALLRQLRRLRVPERAALGPSAAESLDAWGALLAILDQLVRDQQVAGVVDVGPDRLVERFERALQTTPLPPAPRRGGEVEVLDIQDLLGLTPRHLWVVGLTQRAWPRAEPTGFLVPDAILQSLEAPRPAESARYLFSSLLRNALDDREVETLVLSWHASDGGRTTAPSPLIEDLLALPIELDAGQASPVLLRDRLDLRPPPLPPTSVSDVLAQSALEPAWRALAPAQHHPHLATQARLHRARTSPTPGPWEGVLERPPAAPPKRVAVTRMERFLRCPAQFWYRFTLGLGRVDPDDPDITAHRKGNVLHAILEAFLQPRLGRPLTSGATGFESLAAELHAVAVRHLDEVAAAGGVEPALLGYLRDEWLSGLTDDAPHGILRAWLELEREQEHLRLPMAVETREHLDLGVLTLSAGLDRVDRSRSGSLVLDYKTGAAPTPSDVAAGLALQPVAYAEIQAQKAPDKPVAAAYLTLKSADRVRPVGFVGDPVVLDEIGASRSRLDLGPSEREALLDHARAAAVRMQNGLAHTTLVDANKAGCRFCEFRRICRTNPARAEEIARSDADLQRPIPRDAEGDA